MNYKDEGVGPATGTRLVSAKVPNGTLYFIVGGNNKGHPKWWDSFLGMAYAPDPVKQVSVSNGLSVSGKVTVDTSSQPLEVDIKMIDGAKVSTEKDSNGDAVLRVIDDAKKTPR